MDDPGWQGREGQGAGDDRWDDRNREIGGAEPQGTRIDQAGGRQSQKGSNRAEQADRGGYMYGEREPAQAGSHGRHQWPLSGAAWPPRSLADDMLWRGPPPL